MVHNVSADDLIDATDDTDGLAFMSPLGDYRGGDLLLDQIGVQLHYRSHTVCLVRSALLRHRVLPFKGAHSGCSLNSQSTAT